LEEFIDSFHSYHVAARIDVASGHGNRVHVHRLFEICFKDDTKDYSGSRTNSSTTWYRLLNASNANARQTIAADRI
ncbi:4111_t:CDS:2, partial [Scutellospora calospora]